ncbi:IclR family transcriptional regulator domain-containing protein [Pseudonocardia acaciae]|uniref:IclR family transcriptional regulator domain-containing protein n=1 Tax=Pseudonocardia acaciae TaxID=551276 RepID=UPI000AC6E005|nr:IclR family transcriptional regulator C-terminal domain-containing protein [Pseudonocardia acaciae]
MDRDGLVTSLERGLAVLEAFRPERRALTLSEVARLTDLDRASARRLLYTLVDRGYLRTDGQVFRLHPPVARLGHAYLSALELPKIARPHLRELAARVRESVSLAVLDGSEVVYVARVPTKRLMTVSVTVGSRLPAYATSLGKVLLAGQSDDWLDGYLASAQLPPLTPRTITDQARLRRELLRARSRGWAITDGELEPGLRSIALPVRATDGRTAAALNVSSHADRLDPEELAEVALPALRATATAIEEEYARS